jgi:hypothetical protein
MRCERNDDLVKNISHIGMGLSIALVNLAVP